MSEENNLNPVPENTETTQPISEEEERPRMRRRIPKAEKLDERAPYYERPYQERPYRSRYNGEGYSSERPYQPRPYRPRYNSDGYPSDRPYRSHYNSEGYQQNEGEGYHHYNNYNREDGREYHGRRPRYYGSPKGTYSVAGGRPGKRPFQKKKPSGPPTITIPKHVVRYKIDTTDEEKTYRLNRYLANAGVCSRRDADTFIQAGFVKVNDVVVKELGVKVKCTDVVKYKDRILSLEDKVYVLLNKPKNYVTTSEDPKDRKTVMELVRNACPERIYPVGRLDRNTTGVLLCTNDGDLATQLTHPTFLKKKVYHVFLNTDLQPEDLEKLRTGFELEDGEIHADAAEYAKEDDHKQVGIEIHSGRNRIVRRMFEHLGYHVSRLDRVYFAGLTKKNLKRGEWRYLTSQEVNMLKMGAFE